jgi:hypothetical protein
MRKIQRSSAQGRLEPSATASQILILARAAAALLPVLSFLAQWWCSSVAGTTPQFWQHWSVVAVDWLLVPINFLLIKSIDWRQGGWLYVASFLSVVGNISAHAWWQAHLLDVGHLIGPDHVTLAAGWIHLGFAIAEATLIGAYLLTRGTEQQRWLDLLLCGYFLGIAAAGCAMHGRFTLTDVSLACAGVFFLYVWPRVRTAMRSGYSGGR